MPESNWELLEGLFTLACELPDSTRTEFIARHCHGNEALRHELTELLRAHGSRHQ